MRVMDETNPYLGQAIIEAVREQIAIDDPPEVKETYDRLIAEGHPEEEVFKMLACVLSTEMFEIMKQKRVFDRQLYIRRLRGLPELPWE
jgi:predicted peroxiredoxin